MIEDVSSDGRYVLISSAATKFDGVDAKYESSFRDIYLRNTESGETQKLSIGINDETANNDSSDPRFLGKEQVVFYSRATNLVPSFEEEQGLFSYNLLTKTLTAIPFPHGTSYPRNFTTGDNGEYVFASYGQYVIRYSMASQAWDRYDLENQFVNDIVNVARDGSALVKTYNNHVLIQPDGTQEIFRRDSYERSEEMVFVC